MTDPVCPTALSAVQVGKTYGRGESAFTALYDVSLDVAQGESVAIIGKSGSGKSTLMHVLALLDEPDHGHVEVGGLDARTLSRGQVNTLRNKTFGFVFQQFFLTASQSVFDNVASPLTGGSSLNQADIDAIAAIPVVSSLQTISRVSERRNRLGEGTTR